MLIFWIDTFGMRHHKINSEEFNILGESLVCLYGDCSGDLKIFRGGFSFTKTPAKLEVKTKKKKVTISF